MLAARMYWLGRNTGNKIKIALTASNMELMLPVVEVKMLFKILYVFPFGCLKAKAIVIKTKHNNSKAIKRELVEKSRNVF